MMTNASLGNATGITAEGVELKKRLKSMWSTNQDGVGFTAGAESKSTKGNINVDNITVDNFKLKNLTVKNHTMESFAAGFKHNQDSNEFIKVESSLESSRGGDIPKGILSPNQDLKEDLKYDGSEMGHPDKSKIEKSH